MTFIDMKSSLVFLKSVSVSAGMLMSFEKEKVKFPCLSILSMDITAGSSLIFFFILGVNTKAGTTTSCSVFSSLTTTSYVADSCSFVSFA
jgi:hypothetical protein